MLKDLDKYVEIVWNCLLSLCPPNLVSMGVLFPQPLPNLSAVLVGQHNGLVSSAQAEICDQPKQEARAGAGKLASDVWP